MSDSPSPRLTIGIPHLDRTEHLQHAIDSCLAQSVPVRVLVADQGHTEETAGLLARYADHPHLTHLHTPATCLWENWRFAAEACTTEFFAWLQDDDIIERIYASRVIKAFDSFPEALHWQANCHCSPDREHYVKWGWNGPQVGVLRGGRAEQYPGGILLASMYILSWALSPGVAFRCGPEFSAALEGMPSHCDLFSERLILAAMGAQGPFVVDPVNAGYWHHHGDNESYKQNADGSAGKQRSLMVRGLDEILDGSGDWQTPFLLWCRTRNALELLNWIKGFECNESRHAHAVKRIMGDSLEGRIREVPPEVRQALRCAQPTDDGVLIYD